MFLLTGFFSGILKRLAEWDAKLFLAINGRWTCRFLDDVFPWWREANTWIPLYLFLLLFSIINFGKRAIPWIFCAIATATLTDQVSSTLIKNWVGRPRPCRDVFFMSQVRLLLDTCSGGFSFPSSHATNHFGFGMFLFLTLRPVIGKWSWLFFVWAGTVSYGQVYVGVHYPLDVMCGCVLGCTMGWITGTVFNRRFGFGEPFAAKTL